MKDWGTIFECLEHFEFEDSNDFVNEWIMLFGQEDFLNVFDRWDIRELDNEGLRKVLYNKKFTDKFNKVIDLAIGSYFDYCIHVQHRYGNVK